MQKGKKAMQKGLQKESRFRSAAYLAFVRSLPCCLYGEFGCEAHHVIGIRGWGLSGMGIKAPDSFVVPLSPIAHRKVHAEPALQQLQPEWLLGTITHGLKAFPAGEVHIALLEAREFVRDRMGEAV